MLTFNKDKTEVTVSAVPDKRQKGSDGSKGFEIVGWVSAAFFSFSP